MDDATIALRAAGLRVTAPRRAVLAAVRAHPHSDVETITRAARERLDRVSTQAVYDVLAALHRAGLVRRIAPAGSPARYETRTGDNHHHLVCRRCGLVADVDCLLGAAPCLTPVDTRGVEVDEAEILFWGLCPSCQDSSQEPAPPRAEVAAVPPVRPSFPMKE